MTEDRGLQTADGGRYTTLIGLVEHYSPSGGEADAVHWLIARMVELGYERAFRDEVGNAVGVIGDGPRQVILLGHIDTVPGEIPVHLAPSPRPDGQLPSPLLTGEGKGGWGGRGEVLYGRGTVDAKGPLAAFVDAVASVEPVEGWQFSVIGAVDEERDSTGARFVVDQYRPEFAIIGEPSRWDRITLGYKGSAWTEITVTCSVEHSAAQGQSAPEIAVEIWNRLRDWVDKFNAERERAFDQLLPTLRGFSSETDHFQETATLQVGVRLPLNVSPEDWYEYIHQTLKVFTNQSENIKQSETFRVSVQTTGFPIPAYRAEKNSPLVKAFLGAIRIAGGKPGFVVKTGTADLNIVAPKWACPAVAYGPGDSSLDHTPREHLSLAEYQHSVEVLRHVLSRLTKR